ncbi:hypothetical protein HELRODRAFT_172760 [Helobdella robusta]|uniref:Uncharacterized protein n=1 Tax=Helobdella robusta TaxID=6412 RepID=T1F5W9_HELRO|nr:hypothetical protein HELRODRAFT_172760 [Helobdella robusta]ESO04384.1 hypothetical protein HELRODRAFT_172760 [Helobdella robusta]
MTFASSGLKPGYARCPRYDYYHRNLLQTYDLFNNTNLYRLQSSLERGEGDVYTVPRYQPENSRNCSAYIDDASALSYVNAKHLDSKISCTINGFKERKAIRKEFAAMLKEKEEIAPSSLTTHSVMIPKHNYSFSYYKQFNLNNSSSNSSSGFKKHNIDFNITGIPLESENKNYLLFDKNGQKLSSMSKHNPNVQNKSSQCFSAVMKNTTYATKLDPSPTDIRTKEAYVNFVGNEVLNEMQLELKKACTNIVTFIHDIIVKQQTNEESLKSIPEDDEESIVCNYDSDKYKQIDFLDREEYERKLNKEKNTISYQHNLDWRTGDKLYTTSNIGGTDHEPSLIEFIDFESDSTYRNKENSELEAKSNIDCKNDYNDDFNDTTLSESIVTTIKNTMINISGKKEKTIRCDVLKKNNNNDPGKFMTKNEFGGEMSVGAMRRFCSIMDWLGGSTKSLKNTSLRMTHLSTNENIARKHYYKRDVLKNYASFSDSDIHIETKSSSFDQIKNNLCTISTISSSSSASELFMLQKDLLMQTVERSGESMSEQQPQENSMIRSIKSRGKIKSKKKSKITIVTRDIVMHFE